MSTGKERVFVTGATGAVGSDVVRGLIKQGIETTAYVRNEQKAKDLFKDQVSSGLLTFVVGTYSSVDVYTKAIQGHTRLFLLVIGNEYKASSIIQGKETFAKIAFQQGVRQIVDLSSASVSEDGKKGVIGYAQATSEEKLWTLAEENPDQRSVVILRPGAFMSNHFMSDVHTVKHSNKLVSCGSPSWTVTWTDTKGESRGGIKTN